MVSVSVFPLNSLFAIFFWVYLCICLHLYMEAFALVYLCGLFLLKKFYDSVSYYFVFIWQPTGPPGNSVSEINLLVNKYLLSAY